MQQVHNRGNLDLDEDAYFAIIRGKTAELTAVSCRLGAPYAGAPEATVDALESYGRDLGVAFQIADDVLDIWGDERSTGKSLGTDLEKQKLTLPLIRLLDRRPARDRRSRPGPPGRGPAREPPRAAGRPRTIGRARLRLGPRPRVRRRWPSPSSTCSPSRTPSRSSARSATTSFDAPS